jgi:hypothetical protein
MRSVGAHVGVAAAAALAGVCLAAGPLYVSSAASEAVQVGLARTCLTDAGLVVRLGRSPGTPEEALVATATKIAHAQPAIVTETTPQSLQRPGRTTPIRSVLLDRTGQYAELGVPALAANEALSPDWAEPIFGLAPGVHVDGQPFSLTIRDEYPGIPVNPEPSYWCGLRTLLRPSTFGDPPPPMLLVDAAVFRGAPSVNVSRIAEVRPDPKGLTRAEAKQLSDRLDAMATTYTETTTAAPSGGPVGIPIRGARFRNGLPAIIAYAETLSDVVARTVAPVRLAGLAAAGLLLATAGGMLARARATELRLRVLRGVSPVAVGARVGAGAAPAVALGVAAGFVLALLGVMALGPTPEIEPDPLRAALLACLVGALAGTVVVGGVAMTLSARSVDSRPRHHWLRWVPWELAVVAVAIASYARLDRAGGVRLVGSQAQGGDLLAQAFPLLALGAVLVVLARPLRWLLRRSRARGGGLAVPLLIGFRRLSADAGVTVLAALAVGLVIGSVAMSTMLTDSATAMLREKASTFLGSDLVVGVNRAEPLPAALASKATLVLRASTNDDGTSVDVLGIEIGSFARVVGPNPSDRDVASLVASLEGSDDVAAANAIVVHGVLPTATLADATHSTIDVRPVRSATWFPGYRNGATMVVVDRAALEASDLGLASEVWIHDPPPDAVQILRDSGFLIRGSTSASDVFEVTSFLTVRWSYQVFAAFGVLIGVVLVVAQVLVLDARRRSRQASSVIGRRMGLGLGEEATAIFVELVVPFVLGALIGFAAAVAIVHLAIGHLDTLRNLEPPARVVVDLTSIGAAVLVGMVALLALAGIGTIAVARVKPMEAMRSAD